jgi:hypothetical protein
MGRFSRKYKNKLIKEQKKALNKIYKKAGLQGLMDTIDSADDAELIEVPTGLMEEEQESHSTGVSGRKKVSGDE